MRETEKTFNVFVTHLLKCCRRYIGKQIEQTGRINEYNLKAIVKVRHGRLKKQHKNGLQYFTPRLDDFIIFKLWKNDKRELTRKNFDVERFEQENEQKINQYIVLLPFDHHQKSSHLPMKHHSSLTPW